MTAVRMGFGGETISPPAVSGITVTPSTSITGLSSRQVVFGGPTGGVAQSPAVQVDSTNGFLGIGTSGPTVPLDVIGQVKLGSSRVNVNSSGHLGVLTTAPLNPVHILADGAIAGLRMDNTSAGKSAVSFNGGAFPGYVGHRGFWTGTTDSDMLVASDGGGVYLFTGGFANPIIVAGPTGNVTVDSTNGAAVASFNKNVIVGGAGQSVGFFGSTGSTLASSYTTAAATTARLFATTVGMSSGVVSTFTGVSGAGAAFNTRAAAEAFLAQVDALTRVVQTMYQDLVGYGLLR